MDTLDKKDNLDEPAGVEFWNDFFSIRKNSKMTSKELNLSIQELKNNPQFWEVITQEGFNTLLLLMQQADDQKFVSEVNDLLRQAGFLKSFRSFWSYSSHVAVNKLLAERRVIVNQYEPDDVSYWCSCFDVTENYAEFFE